MHYVRKKPKGFGRNAQIEGHLIEGQRVLLVEDMTTDGRSKINFCNALREAGAKVEHVFVFFFYDIFPEAPKILTDLGVTLHSLATWWDVLAVAKASGKFDAAKLAEVENFMHDPAGWSKAHGGVSRGRGGVTLVPRGLDLDRSVRSTLCEELSDGMAPDYGLPELPQCKDAT